MFSYDPKLHWPGAEDLPDSDDTPVDNELQDLIPGLLKSILALIWSNRWDWFFGVDMGIYDRPDEPPIIPDGFLSLGVERVFDPDLRLSYVLWEERVIPQLVVEVVSETYRGEYSRKKEKYGELGVLYYAVYSPRRRRKPRLEVYQLVDGVYELLSGEPVWLAQIGLGIGRAEGTYLGIKREWLYWFDERGERFLTPEERLQESQERLQETEQRLQDAELRAQRLAEQLRSLGVDPQEY